MTPMDELNSLPDDVLFRRLREVGGSGGWARRVAEQRPFQSAGALIAAGDDAWLEIEHDDWLEAFAARTASVPDDADAASSAAAQVALDLYRERFGYPFVTSAQSRAADELLMRVRIRLGNEPDAEWSIACEEQRRSARLRLTALATGVMV